MEGLGIIGVGDEEEDEEEVAEEEEEGVWKTKRQQWEPEKNGPREVGAK